MTINGNRILCVIPARAGSRRIPGKNMKLFHGKPIIQYSIEAAKESGLFDRIIVSTDSHDAADLAVELGVEYQWRLSFLATDDVGTQQVGSTVTQMHQDRSREKFDLVCILYATAPLISLLDLHAGLLMLLEHQELNFVYAAEETPGAGPLMHAGQFYWCRAKPLLLGEELDGPTTGRIFIDQSRVCDINYPVDWAFAEAKYQTLLDREHAVL